MTYRIPGSLSLAISLSIGLVGLMAASTVGQNVRWAVNYGGDLNEDGYAACPTADGGFMVLGSTFSYGAGDHDLYLLRIDSLGDTLWTNTLGGAEADYGYDIQRTTDGGFVVVGATYSSGAGNADVLLSRIDGNGVELWSKTYGGTDRDIGSSIRVLPDDGLIIAGKTRSFGAGADDFYLVRTDANGDTLWSRTYGGPSGETAYAVRSTFDGGLIIAGSTGSYGDGYSSAYVVRTNADGDTLWTRTYGGSSADIAYTIEQVPDGSFVVAGASYSFGSGNADMYLIKTDPNGNLEWDDTYGGGEDDRAYSVTPLADGGYLLGGTTLSYGSGQFDIYALKTDPLGTATWSQTYGGTKADYCRSIAADGDGYVLVGYTFSWGAGGSDVYLVKISGELTTDVEEYASPELPEAFTLAQNYPNPFNGGTRIDFELAERANVTIVIHNVLGQVVRQWRPGSLSAGFYSIAWDGRTEGGHHVASGVYFYSLQTATARQSRKMILLR